MHKSAIASINGSISNSNNNLNDSTTAPTFATIIKSTPPPLAIIGNTNRNHSNSGRKKGRSYNTSDAYDKHGSGGHVSSTHGLCTLSTATLADIFDKVASPNLSAALRAAAAHGKGTTDVQTLKHVAQQEIELREIDPFQFM